MREKRERWVDVVDMSPDRLSYLSYHGLMKHATPLHMYTHSQTTYAPTPTHVPANTQYAVP